MIKYHILEKAKALGYSKTDLIKKVPMSSRTLAKISEDKSITMDTLIKICRLLDCQPGELIEYVKESDNALLKILREEMHMNYKGGIYHQTQVIMAYNSNHIEGSRLSEEQTRYIFETNTIGIEDDFNSLNVDDIIEASNHFECFKEMIETAENPLTEESIKNFHRILKAGTSDSKKDWFNVGEYKLKANSVGGKRTTPPSKVRGEIINLLDWYNSLEMVTENEIIEFHYRFETIHPFQDGNGRVGRLIMFKECLKHGLTPIIIEDIYKEFYYRGLKNYEIEKGFLVDTCLNGQDQYQKVIDSYGDQ